ncbi:hypothetical protein THOM_3103 [Trachipleistophora hominis]|uniref:Uncharacterized protein n=1 Tax=Trachipleistophora hominis TaxID=72359 RepID=L7JR63_TRAHO|nr:hypothetical protein THOM_3103 [Trachipleistophora hominis]
MENTTMHRNQHTEILTSKSDTEDKNEPANDFLPVEFSFSQFLEGFIFAAMIIVILGLLCLYIYNKCRMHNRCRFGSTNDSQATGLEDLVSIEQQELSPPLYDEMFTVYPLNNLIHENNGVSCHTESGMADNQSSCMVNYEYGGILLLYMFEPPPFYDDVVILPSYDSTEASPLPEYSEN